MTLKFCRLKSKLYLQVRQCKHRRSTSRPCLYNWIIPAAPSFICSASVTFCVLIWTKKATVCVWIKRTDKKQTHTLAHTHTHSHTFRRRCSYPIKPVISHLTSQKDNTMLLCEGTIDEANDNIPPRSLPPNMSRQIFFSLPSLSLSHFSDSSNISSR